MKIHEMIEYLLQFPPTTTVRLWNWFPLAGSGAEYDLHFTANKGGDIIRMSVEGGRDFSTGPQKQTYLRVVNRTNEIVGDVWLTPEEADFANSFITYYGESFITPAAWVEETGQELPEEYREEEGGE